MEKLYSKIAETHNTAPDEVESQIDYAIRFAMNNPSSDAQNFWKQLASDGKQPSPEEVINAIIAQVLNDIIAKA